jgi:hypothetical protein
VDTVVKAYDTASNNERPDTRRAMAMTTVNATYTSHRRLAVSLTRGARRSDVGPGASALINSNPPTPRNGNTATARTITPMPPNHCVIWRQNATPRSRPWGSAMSVEPVQLNPEIDSNKASSNAVKVPESR